MISNNVPGQAVSLLPHPISDNNPSSSVVTENIIHISNSPDSFIFLNNVVLEDKIIKNKCEKMKAHVAVYGFGQNQIELLRFIKNNFNVHEEVMTIATLNRMLGLIKYTVNELKFPKGIESNQVIINAIKTMGDDLTIKKKIKDSHVLINDWLVFLTDNKHKIDIFSYVNSKALTQENKNNLIKKLILKNVSSKVSMPVLFAVFDEIKLFNAKSITEACECLRESKLPLEHLSATFELIQQHFFRNTSKLGLSFFRMHGYAISIAWNKHGYMGKINPEMISLSAVLHKPFNQGERRLGNAEPITYSEIRHVIRHQDEFDDLVYRINLQRKSVFLSSGINNENWFEYKEPNLLSLLLSCGK